MIKNFLLLHVVVVVVIDVHYKFLYIYIINNLIFSKQSFFF